MKWILPPPLVTFFKVELVAERLLHRCGFATCCGCVCMRTIKLRECYAWHS